MSVDLIVEGASLEAEIENQSVSSHGKLALVNASGVSQEYRSRWRSDMNNLLRTHVPDFFVTQVHPIRQSPG